jgi:thymidylate synthase
LEQTRLQLERTPGALPMLQINPDKKDIFGFVFDDFELLDYHPQAHISAPVAV